MSFVEIAGQSLCWHSNAHKKADEYINLLRMNNKCVAKWWSNDMSDAPSSDAKIEIELD